MTPRAGLLLALLALVSTSRPASAGGFRLFADSPTARSTDLSYGYRTSPGFVSLAINGKFPVDTVQYFLGRNSLRLLYTSSTTGDWALAAITPGFQPVSVASLDSLVFYIRPSATIPLAELPSVFIEDNANHRTSRFPLNLAIASAPGATWTRVVIPMSWFQANAGIMDLNALKLVFFGATPGVATTATRLVNVDEIRFVDTDATPPPTPAGFRVREHERHAEIGWDAPANADIDMVRIERNTGTGWTRVGIAPSEEGGAIDWLDATGVTARYRVIASDMGLRLSPPSDSSQITTRALTDAEFLDRTQEAAFRYFWDHGHPVSGLSRERTTSGDVCTSGGTGMGVMAMIMAADRGFITRADARARVQQIVTFLRTQVPQYLGAYPHWINGTTGQPIGFLSPTDDTRDLVETSYLFMGLLSARSYFGANDASEIALRNDITAMWTAVQWDAFVQSGGTAITWHRSPTTGFSVGALVTGWNEAMITYLLAKASPTHAIATSLYHTGWAQNGAIVNGNTYYGTVLPLGPAYGGPLFFEQYTPMGFDPHYGPDTYADYFQQGVAHTLINRAYCQANPNGRVGYSSTVWGLTASDELDGYSAHAPFSNDNGTLSPTAAFSSYPFTPTESMAAMRAMYNTYGSRLWGVFGPKDAFSPTQANWYAGGYIAIDQGPIAVMIENGRTGLLWNHFMNNPEVLAALSALGFVRNPGWTTDTPGTPAVPRLALAAGPNPSRGAVTFACALPAPGRVQLALYDLRGARVTILSDATLPAGSHTFQWDGRDAHGMAVSPGMYLARLEAGRDAVTTRIIRLAR
ncbi:MAG: glucoamylase family protein [Candidatus Eisenbacteria bacterium]